MKPFAACSLCIAAAIVAGNILLAANEPEIYQAPLDYRVERRTIDGNDRVVVFATAKKLVDCDLDRAGGPLWVVFSDEGEEVPPISAFYRPDGSQSGSNTIRAGQSMQLNGYSATIPNRMRGFGGAFTVMIPCQVFTTNAKGEREYGRERLATWGPIPVPPPGSIVEGVRGKITFRAGIAAERK